MALLFNYKEASFITRKLYSTTISTCQNQRQPLSFRPHSFILLAIRQSNHRKRLQKSYNSIRDFHYGKVFTKARSMATTEWEIRPADI
jgi:hypothetical protein